MINECVLKNNLYRLFTREVNIGLLIRCKNVTEYNRKFVGIGGQRLWSVEFKRFYEFYIEYLTQHWNSVIERK